MLFSKYTITAFIMSVTLSYLGVASAQPVKAQIGASKGSQVSPTKAQTAEFLSQKIGMRHVELSGYPDKYDRWETKSSFFDDNCTLRHETSQYKEEKLIRRTVMEVGLSKIDPSRIGSFAVTSHSFAKVHFGLENPSHIVQLLTTGNEKNLRITFTNAGQVSENPTSVEHAWVFTADADTAQRVGKALQHLIVTCGGKKELF